MEQYKIEMVLMIYSIVIGFSFNIFRENKLKTFQFIVAISLILCLAGRLLSVYKKFHPQPILYNEIYFLIDIFIMVAFYRSLTILRRLSCEESNEENNYQYIWLWLGITMTLTFAYRTIYSGISVYSGGQILAVLFCLGGFGIANICQRKHYTEQKLDRLQLMYSIPFFLGCLVYCVMRFRITEL
ncbi:hypothetical protein [Candidatus Uabimicrobium amorphum]|uniref:Uncharacterized protein n=1 Tax=Uabimicrobium amorphum TaxID=2596890 RepID=A0A5S9IKB7_UABAM|nr:hypothetical protein [Candidatus Uabimicrobium amorphum]BBM82165.1 hypothetical protein UABAM_00508 [Candidatus Uabimicrobium amorphum]